MFDFDRSGPRVIFLNSAYFLFEKMNNNRKFSRPKCHNFLNMTDFSNEIRRGNRKPNNEMGILDGLRNKQISIAPASYEWITDSIAANRKLTNKGLERTVFADGLIDITWLGKTVRFVAEIKSSNTPKTIEAAVLKAKDASISGLPPLIIVPYLSEENIKSLEISQVSGFDLCGNMIIFGGGLYLWRAGQPNLFPETRPIKNIYRGRGSIFARCFLLKREFGSLAELRDFALRRLEPKYLLEPENIDLDGDSRLATSTASKVISALGDDLILERTPTGFELSDPRALAYKLRINYKRPSCDPIQGKTPFSRCECWERLRGAIASSYISAASTGLGSATHYDALATEDKISLRVSDSIKAMELLKVTPTRAFPNIEFSEDDDETALFDCRLENGVIWASPIQTLLELSAGGPRERDASDQFETRLLRQG